MINVNSVPQTHYNVSINMNFSLHERISKDESARAALNFDYTIIFLSSYWCLSYTDMFCMNTLLSCLGEKM